MVKNYPHETIACCSSRHTSPDKSAASRNRHAPQPSSIIKRKLLRIKPSCNRELIPWVPLTTQQRNDIIPQCIIMAWPLRPVHCQSVQKTNTSIATFARLLLLMHPDTAALQRKLLAFLAEVFGGLNKGDRSTVLNIHAWILDNCNVF